MKFWLAILFFLTEGALFSFGVVCAVRGSFNIGALHLWSFLPLAVALIIILGLFAKLGCIDNTHNPPGRHH